MFSVSIFYDNTFDPPKMTSKNMLYKKSSFASLLAFIAIILNLMSFLGGCKNLILVNAFQPPASLAFSREKTVYQTTKQSSNIHHRTHFKLNLITRDNITTFSKPSTNRNTIGKYPFGLAAKSNNNDPNEKFTFAQRIESTKTALVGLLSGGIALTPFTFFHDVLSQDDSIVNNFGQFEFDTDMGSLECALFAIVYRYCVREGEETNEMLGMGVIAAFAVVRTLSRIQVPVYCSAAPLQCGEPLGYFSWDMLTQAGLSGLESVVMFSVAAAAMDYCYSRGIISRFR